MEARIQSNRNNTSTAAGWLEVKTFEVITLLTLGTDVQRIVLPTHTRGFRGRHTWVGLFHQRVSHSRFQSVWVWIRKGWHRVGRWRCWWGRRRRRRRQQQHAARNTAEQPLRPTDAWKLKFHLQRCAAFAGLPAGPTFPSSHSSKSYRHCR